MYISSNSSNSSSGVMVPHDSFEILGSDIASALLAVDFVMVISGILEGVVDRDLREMLMKGSTLELITRTTVLLMVCMALIVYSIQLLLF